MPALTVSTNHVMGHRIWMCAIVIKTADIHADKLMRLRSNLCLWGEPPIYSGRGKPRVHGDKFKLNDASTWSEPTQRVVLNSNGKVESKKVPDVSMCFHELFQVQVGSNHQIRTHALR
jgi:hypothetical protein